MKGTILVVNVSLQEAKNRLYRRECNEIGSKLIYAEPPKVGPNTVFIKTLTDLAGSDGPIYAYRREYRAADSRGARCSSDQSARSRDDDRDGITYLINALKHGIRTTLSETYAAEILRQLGAGDLQDRW